MSTLFEHDTEFQKLVAGRDDVDLVGLMLEFAGDAYGHVCPVAVVGELDRLGRMARVRMDGSTGTLRSKLEIVSKLLFADEGFCGNEAEYYDPKNSYLHEVLNRRLGIPISLALVFQEVAGRAGVPAHGVAAPGHFMIGAETDDEHWYVDPFGGDVLDRLGCLERVRKMSGGVELVDLHRLGPATPLEIAARTLRNLKAAYAAASNWRLALPVQQRLAVLLPELADERRDLGLIYLRNGQPGAALKLLEKHLTVCSPDDAEQLQPFVRSARKMIAEMN